MQNTQAGWLVQSAEMMTVLGEMVAMRGGVVCLDNGNFRGSGLLQEGRGCYSGEESGENQEKEL